jgi:predicted Ser/Thr protein kinase
VSEAIEENTGRVIALKQVRAPLRLKRTLLEHEARVLQALQGHPVIPVIYGYGRLKHFEYLAMELLGPSIREKWPGSLACIPVKTVVSVVQQAVRSFIYHTYKTKLMLTLIHESAFRPRTHS